MKFLESARRWGYLTYHQILGVPQRTWDGGPWEDFWGEMRRQRPGGGPNPWWDDDPENAAAVDLGRFRPAFMSRLPLVDLGCGNGRQTRFLAHHFRHVIGIDVSSSAVEMANRLSLSHPNLTYRVLDGADPEAIAALAREIGDANVYLRGVCHGLDDDARRRLAENLWMLLGRRGTLYLVDVNHRALDGLPCDPVVPGTDRTASPTASPSRGFDADDRRSFFPETRWRLLGEGPTTLHTVLFDPLAGGTDALLPATWSLLRPRRETEH